MEREEWANHKKSCYKQPAQSIISDFWSFITWCSTDILAQINIMKSEFIWGNRIGLKKQKGTVSIPNDALGFVFATG